MFSWVANFLASLFAKNSSCKSYIEVYPFRVLSKEAVEKLMSKMPLFWYNTSGKKKVLVVVIFTEDQDYSNYGKRLVKFIVENYPEYKIGLFFSDIPDPGNKDKNFRSKVVAFYCKAEKSIEDFFNLEKLSNSCPDEKYEVLEKEIEEKESLLYSLANYRISFPVIILEDGRMYCLEIYRSFPIEDVLCKIFSQEKQSA